MCLTMVLNQNEVAYALTDNAATCFRINPADTHSKEELLDAVDFTFDYGSKLILLKDNAVLIWTTRFSHPMGYIEGVVQKINYSSNPEDYMNIPELCGYLVKSNPLEIYAFKPYVGIDLLKIEIEKPNDLTVNFESIGGWFDSMVEAEFKLSLPGCLPLNEMEPSRFKRICGETLIKINRQCSMIGPKPHLARIDSNEVKIVE